MENMARINPLKSSHGMTVNASGPESLGAALFSDDRLLTVGTRIRDLYPAKNPDCLLRRVDGGFLRALVRQVTVARPE